MGRLRPIGPLALAEVYPAPVVQTGDLVTFQGESTRSGSNVLKTLVVITIVLVAYWAASGGLDRIEVPSTTPTSSTTTTVNS